MRTPGKEKPSHLVLRNRRTIAEYEMQIRRSSLALLFCLLAGPFVVRAAEPSPADAARVMVDSEKKFYRTAEESGTRVAFLTFLADDGIVFRPGPVNGKEVWTKRPATGLDLVWEPTFAAIARSGDFGYTTGPAKWRASKQEEKFLGYGQFISIWKKQKDGSWKVALDCGIENQEPTGTPAALRVFVPDDSQPVKTADARHKALPLPEAHAKFVAAAKTNSTDAVLEAAAEELRVYREGNLPAIGKSAAAALLGAKGGKVSFEQMGGDMSRTADLAYSYGKYNLQRSEGSKAGHFFQIWQTDPTGMWKLVVDWQQPLPK
jgi:ketosteroid isomerase-like protein